jgi:hypothetical protein
MIEITKVEEFADWFRPQLWTKRVGVLRIGPYQCWYLRVGDRVLCIGRAK